MGRRRGLAGVMDLGEATRLYQAALHEHARVSDSMDLEAQEWMTAELERAKASLFEVWVRTRPQAA